MRDRVDGLSGGRAEGSCRGRLSTLLVLLLAGCSSDGRTALMLYSPHGRSQLALFEQTYEARHPQVDVRYLDMGSQEVLDRIRSERANPQADVWFGGPSALFARGAADSLLAPYRPSWAEGVPSESRGPGDLYFGVYRTPAVIAFNSEVLDTTTAPRDWDEALDPRFTGKLIIRDPLASGTMRAIFGMVIQRSLRATGDTAQGMAWLRRLDAQVGGDYVLNPALLLEKLARREGWVTLWDLPDILLTRRQGRPLAHRYPISGTPVIDDAIAVVRGGRQVEEARRFVEWVGSVEAQLMAARTALRLPARHDIPPDSLPDWAREELRHLKAEPMDWELVAREGDGWMRYWDRYVRGSGKGR